MNNFCLSHFFCIFASMKRFLIIPDQHGRNYWKKFGDLPEIFEQEAFYGYDVPLIKPKFDKYIFLGDYCDSFTKDSTEIKNNLIDVIKFKKYYPDHVILLWGNHEIHYLYSAQKHGCSGFRPLMWFDLNEIFRKYRLLFQYAYQYDNYLFTHAGVHKGWYEYRFKFFDDQKTLGDSLNWGFEQNLEEMFDVGHIRGGMQKVGSPLWVDKKLSSKKPLKGYHQFVGHTPVNDISKFSIDENTSITFCDNQKDEDSIYFDKDNLDKYYHILEIDDKESKED